LWASSRATTFLSSFRGAGRCRGRLALEKPNAARCSVPGTMQSRIQTGATAAALTLSSAAFVADSHRCLAAVLLVVTFLIGIATFANKLPVLHTLPGVGSPDLEATFAQEASPSGASNEVMIRIGLKVPTRIEDAVLNFLVPVDIEFWNSDFEGKPSGKGRLMLPTDEPLNPGIEFSNYWADNVELRFGSGLMNFVLRVTQPRSFNVRLRVGSEKLYKNEYVADFEVTVK
jgi:hypothetical protein